MNHLFERVVPASFVQERYEEVAKACNEENQAVIVTQNGIEDIVLLGYKQYQELKARLELMEIIGEAEQDVLDGKMSPIREMFDRLHAGIEEQFSH